jgi:hypothetical protein
MKQVNLLFLFVVLPDRKDYIAAYPRFPVGLAVPGLVWKKNPGNPKGGSAPWLSDWENFVGLTHTPYVRTQIQAYPNPGEQDQDDMNSFANFTC